MISLLETSFYAELVLRLLSNKWNHVLYLNPGHTTLNFQAELIVYRKADIVKDPMKSISFVPKNDIHRVGGVGV